MTVDGFGKGVSRNTERQNPQSQESGLIRIWLPFVDSFRTFLAQAA